MTDKKTSFKLNSNLLLLVIVGILIAINVISNYFFTRIDLTEEKIFTLAPTSIETVKNLDDKLFIKAYFSADIPSPFSNTRQYLQDQLDEYRAYSNGNLVYEFISDSLDREAPKAGIQPVDLRVVENDQISVRRVYLGLVMNYEDKKEVMPFIQSSEGLEYDLTKRILKLTTESTKKIGFLTGHDEADEKSLQTVRSHLLEQYQVVPVSTEFGKKIPQDIAALLVISPKKALSEWDKYAIDQYLIGGGKVGFYLNQVAVELSQQQSENLNLNLDNLLASYGIKVNQNLVQDLQNQPINVQERRGIFNINRQIPYPFLPLVRTFAKGEGMVKDLENVSFYFASTIDTTAAKETSVYKVLAYSSPYSKTASGEYQLYPQDPSQINKNDYNLGKQALAVSVSGKITSAFASGNRPQFMRPDSTFGDDIQPTLLETENARVFVVGDGDFMQENFKNQPDNINLFLNSVDWLASSEGLISIRSREVTDRKIEEITDGKKDFIKWGNSIGLPLLVLVFGLVRWQVRKNHKVEV
ncbi:Gldg family protein [bacterium]|nr:Gldg family protein [bacterium]